MARAKALRRVLFVAVALAFVAGALDVARLVLDDAAAGHHSTARIAVLHETVVAPATTPPGRSPRALAGGVAILVSLLAALRASRRRAGVVRHAGFGAGAFSVRRRGPPLLPVLV